MRKIKLELTSEIKSFWYTSFLLWISARILSIPLMKIQIGNSLKKETIHIHLLDILMPEVTEKVTVQDLEIKFGSPENKML